MADDIARYTRQLALAEVGPAGQARLRAARVVVVGAGGLGSPALLYLAAAGVGTLGVIDPDIVETTNLHRQPLHGDADVGRPKVESAVSRLRALNPEVHVAPIRARLDAANARELLTGWDVVLDATDTFAARYAASDACVDLGVPYVYGSAVRFDGQASVFVANGAPCYRCIFPEAPPPGLAPSCAEAGVLGVLPGMIGMIQATETLKLLLGIGDTLAGRLLLVDVLRMRTTEIAVERDPGCAACGAGARPQAATADLALPFELSPRELAARRAAGEAVALLDVREEWEWQLARIEGARLVPLGTLASVLSELDPARELVVLCHHGVRSAWAAEQLRAAGIRGARNLTGGIDAWSVDVDPSVRRY